MQIASYYVYIVTNRSHTLYIGVTNDLERRVYEHKTKKIKDWYPGFQIQERTCSQHEGADVR